MLELLSNDHVLEIDERVLNFDHASKVRIGELLSLRTLFEIGLKDTVPVDYPLNEFIVDFMDGIERVHDQKLLGMD